MRYSVGIEGPVGVDGRITVPGDKSITHRALIFSALADGRSLIENALTSADCLSTLNCLRGLGVEIELQHSTVAVVGRGLFGLVEPEDVLDVGNSGTALRVLPAILAGQNMTAVLTGDESVRSRPVDRVLTPLRKMGARIWARANNRLAPVIVSGARLSGIEYELPVASAQVKTAILAAGLLADGETTVVEPVPSRDHTEIMLRYLGLSPAIEEEPTGGRRITLVGRHPFQAQDISVPGDISSAAFFLVAGALAGTGRIEAADIGVNPTRTGFLDFLRSMDAKIEVKNESLQSGEPTATLTAAKSVLRPAHIGGALIPRMIDELPLAALLATQAEGRTVIKDAAELRVKETDRIALTAAELNKMGARVSPTEDGFVIDGPTKLKGARVDSHGDHRLAMMLAVAALAADGRTLIEGAEAVDVSFPGFFAALKEIGVELSRA